MTTADQNKLLVKNGGCLFENAVRDSAHLTQAFEQRLGFGSLGDVGIGVGVADFKFLID